MNRGLAIVLVVVALALAFIAAQLAEGRVQYLPPEYLTRTVGCPAGEGYGASNIPIVDEIEAEWYPKHWRAAHEPSLYLASLEPVEKRVEVLRFTMLPTFMNPFIVRLDETPGGGLRLTAKRLSGAGGYAPGTVDREVTRMLSAEEVKRVRAEMASARPFAGPPADCNFGMDGTRWILEVSGRDGYRYINRWSPQDGSVRQIGLLLLGLTHWKDAGTPVPDLRI